MEWECLLCFAALLRAVCSQMEQPVHHLNRIVGLGAMRKMRVDLMPQGSLQHR